VVLVINHLDYELGVQAFLPQGVQHGRSDSRPVSHRENADTGQVIVLDDAADFDLLGHESYSVVKRET